MRSTVDQANYYDDRWASFQYANLFGLERCRFILQALSDLQLEQPRICDFGCGAGWLTGILSSFGPTVGVDLSPQAIERAKKLYPIADFVCADGTHWNTEPESFDVVVSQEVIEHIEDKASYLRVVRHALRSGGHLLMTTPNLDVLRAVSIEERRTVWEVQPIELPLNRKQLDSLLQNENFDVLRRGSVVTHCGKLGWQRLLNSHKVREIFSAAGLREHWDAYLRSAGYGMYLTTVARKRAK